MAGDEKGNGGATAQVAPESTRPGLSQALRRPLQNLFLAAEGLFDRLFGPLWNPLRQLGTLAFFFFWVCAASGIYVYIFFETSVTGAFASVEYLTHQQWYLGGVMRSLHRYSADAMVVTMVLHLIREFVFDRYRGVRWFAWFTGVPLIWFLYMSGISGYWLVWDKLAQYVAIGSMEWLDGLGIFGEPVANNFLSPESLSDRFFSLLVFMHIFVPLFLLFLMWIHVLRVTQPQINPPRGLAFGSLLMLLALAMAKPALSHAAADLATVPTVLHLDWFYMALYPLFDRWGAVTLWVLAVGVSLIAAAMPWLPPLRRAKAAEVALEKCNGCARCFADCPYSSITMQPRSDGLPYEQEAVVDPKLCVSCGICVGACPVSTPFRHGAGLMSAIELPGLPLAKVKALLDEALDGLSDETNRPRVIVFGCDHGVDTKLVEGVGVRSLRLPCTGMLPPSFIDYVLSQNRADGVVVTGCREGDCYNRLGIRWTEDRIAGRRDPYLRKRVPRERLRTAWAARTETGKLADEIKRFREFLRTLRGQASAGEPVPDQETTTSA